MRVISRLDIKNEFVIKGIHLEGLRKVGDPVELAIDYYRAGIDEIIFMDAVASLYDRNNVFHIIEQACKQVFIPITIGGGIRSLSDIEQALIAGADKVAINTGAVNSPQLINEAVLRFGSQCIVASIEAKSQSLNQGSEKFWQAYIDNGRESTGKNLIEWVKELSDRGVGEILITSVDQEGTKRGFDVELIKLVNDAVNVPVIACGGLGEKKHIQQLLNNTAPSAIACASVLHYKKQSIEEIKTTIREQGFSVREPDKNIDTAVLQESKHLNLNDSNLPLGALV
ncbi:imidazole glycerol phosphate synthase subunit HisF [Aurantivibrio infirmus]